MFSSMKKRMDETVAANDIETVIGKNTHIKGEIGGSGNLRIDGEIEGSIDITGSAVIGEDGGVTGDIKAESLIVSGAIQGNCDIQGALTIRATGQLVGDIKSKSLNIEDGGIFKGRSEMQLRATVTTVAEAKAAVDASSDAKSNGANANGSGEKPKKVHPSKQPV